MSDKPLIGLDGDYEVSDASRLVARPLVSVFVLTYNHEQYIEQSLESVVGQQADFDFEIVVGEDCSTDATRARVLELLARYPDRIRLVTANANVGVFRNYLRLLRACRGRYLAHLDGDDYWLPGKLAQQVALLQSRDVAAVYANAVTVDRKGSELGRFNDAPAGHISLAQLVRRGNFLNTSSMMFRAEFRDRVTDDGAPFLDYRTHLRLATHGGLWQLDGPLVAYRVETEGSMVARSNAHVRELYWAALKDVPPEALDAHDRALGIANFLRRVTLRSVRTRDRNLFMSWLARVRADFPGSDATLALLLVASLCDAGASAMGGWLLRLVGIGERAVLHRR